MKTEQKIEKKKTSVINLEERNINKVLILFV